MAFPDYGSPSPTKPNDGKTPPGGLGQMMQRLLGGGGPQGSSGPGPQGAGAPMMGAPPQMPGMPGPVGPAMPGAAPMPGLGGPIPSPSISPEEYQAILEQIKGELMKDIAGQSGQQDTVFSASSQLSRYRPMGNPSFPNIPHAPTPPLSGMPQDVQFPPGMDPAGLDRWRKTGNPNPGMGMPPRRPAAPPRPQF